MIFCFALCLAEHPLGLLLSPWALSCRMLKPRGAGGAQPALAGAVTLQYQPFVYKYEHHQQKAHLGISL